jgi:hypothetical protein
MNWWEWLVAGLGFAVCCAVLYVAATWADSWRH